MTRSPLAYPLNRSADMDAGGAADLQTDIMRFMAILSLCLVAIFALVQSIPLRPAEPLDPVEQVPTGATTATIANGIEKEEPATAKPAQQPGTIPADAVVTLTRPKWKPKFVPERTKTETTPATAAPQELTTAVAQSAPLAEAPLPVESEGFTLRFESDTALTRLVAANKIGVYAIGKSRALRMTVSESRISFWDASTPNSFHEMEAETVPAPVIEALARSGTSANEVSWGVTLPGRLKTRLDDLMRGHDGGALIIISSGDIRWEAT